MPPWLPTAIIAALCAASAALWSVRLSRRGTSSTGPAAIDAASDDPPVNPEPPREDSSLPVVPPGALVLAGLWILFQFVDDVSSTLDNAPEPAFDPDQTLGAMQRYCWLLVGGAGVGWMLLTRGEHGQFRAFGATTDRLARQLRNGLGTVTAAWLPVFAVILATLPLRTVERQHSVFQLLAVRSSLEVYVWAILSAVVVAPLFEELLFRVILQTSLERAVGRAAIPVAAVVFAAVHGFPDSLAIVPLALVLGDAYQQRRSYWEVVTAHGLFNAVMLALDAVMPHG